MAQLLVVDDEHDMRDGSRFTFTRPPTPPQQPRPPKPASARRHDRDTDNTGTAPHWHQDDAAGNTREPVDKQPPALPVAPPMASFDHVTRMVLNYLHDHMPLAFWSVTRVQNGRQSYLYIDPATAPGPRGR